MHSGLVCEEMPLKFWDSLSGLYCIQFWSPHLRKDALKLERGWRKEAKMIRM